MSSPNQLPSCFSFLRSRNKADVAAPSAKQASSPSTAEPHHGLENGEDFPCMCDFSVGQATASDAPPSYDWAREKVLSGFDDKTAKTIEDKIDEINGELRELSIKIHDHPELAFQEKYAHDTLTAFMESHGFDVTRHYLGLETAWLATFKSGKGGRVLGFNSEMDALPGIGHACGHNLIAIGGVAAAIGVATALRVHSIPGRVSLIGTPAEEGGAGKVILLNKGAYKDFAACLMIHPSPGDAHVTSVISSLAVEGVNAEFQGQTAHAAAAPWEGRNSLDAAFISYAAISALRQQVKPTHRIHGVVEGRDWAANIIPDYAKMKYLIRAPSYKEILALEPRLKACFEAGAHATSTKLTISTTTLMYDLFQNGALTQEYKRICEGRYGMKVNLTGDLRASTDFGNITYAIPACHPGFSIPTKPEGGNHTAAFTAAARTKEAHEATLFAAKGIAVAGLRVLVDEEFAKQVKLDFEAGKQ